MYQMNVLSCGLYLVPQNLAVLPAPCQDTGLKQACLHHSQPETARPGTSSWVDHLRGKGCGSHCSTPKGWWSGLHLQGKAASYNIRSRCPGVHLD